MQQKQEYLLLESKAECENLKAAIINVRNEYCARSTNIQAIAEIVQFHHATNILDQWNQAVMKNQQQGEHGDREPQFPHPQ
ncbi:hypothetical protein FGO68_gene7285 [Halteria grandinella]|uniref:Uncharacterized protein n=1 Tax=Halteria grandinella TaxID=5974 RepID=A0A8J8NZX9_HALGN|nr:hypothetical protein FGO68_gene7285 [Halteria grandinella]